jgi:hypothetical protein
MGQIKQAMVEVRYFTEGPLAGQPNKEQKTLISQENPLITGMVLMYRETMFKFM